MFSLIALVASYRRQQAAARQVSPLLATPARAVANDRTAVQGLARAA
jgi:hypothetical protein